MIDWLLLVPTAVVIIVLAVLLARAAVGDKPWQRTSSSTPRTQSPPARLPTFLVRAELPILIVICPLFLFTSPLTVFALALIPLLWGARWLARGYLLPSTPLDWPIALMAIMIPVGLLVSPDISWGAGRAAFLVYGIALYYALVDWITSPRRLDLALSLYLLAGGAMALLALIGTDWQYKFPFLGDLTHVLPQIANTLSRDQTGFHPNIVAGALLWVIFPLLALVMRGRTTDDGRPTTDDASLLTSKNDLRSTTYDLRLTHRRLPLLILLLLTGGTLLLTQSRGALASAAAGLGLLAWLRWPRLRPAIAIAAIAAVALVSVALTLEISAGKQAVAASDFSVFAADNFVVRIDTWQSALRAISAHPLEGIGLDAFRHLLPTTYPATSIPDTYDIGHAHNQFLQAALDLGLPGLLGYLALWLTAGRIAVLMLAPGAARQKVSVHTWGGETLASGLVRTHPRPLPKGGEKEREGQAGGHPQTPGRGAPVHPPVKDERPTTDDRRPMSYDLRSTTYDLRLTIYDSLAAGFAAALLASFLHGMIDVVVMVSKPGMLFWAMLALLSALWRLTATQRVSTLQE